MTAICTEYMNGRRLDSGRGRRFKGLIVRGARARGQRSQPHHDHRQVIRLGETCVKRDCGDGVAAVDSTPSPSEPHHGKIQPGCLYNRYEKV